MRTIQAKALLQVLCLVCSELFRSGEASFDESRWHKFGESRISLLFPNPTLSVATFALMTTLFDRLAEARAYLASHTDFQPRTGLILGTGLGGLIDELDLHMRWDYGLIPHFPVSTVEGHGGDLRFGYLAGEPVVVLNGRHHYYEGYSAETLTFPTRLICSLGLERLLISNVAGGTSADYRAGDVVIVRDHINFQPDNPLRGANDERLGLRFPDLLRAYDPDLRAQARLALQALDLPAHEGVYFGLQGPNLETPAEYRMIQRLGGDLVGMSTVPEVLVANHMRVPVLVTSLVSNECHDVDALTSTTLEAVLAVARVGGARMQALWLRLLEQFAQAEKGQSAVAPDAPNASGSISSSASAKTL